jgi:putative SOS response-associated peptidase YedK
MPVILRREDENQWLGDGIDENRLQSMLSPYRVEEMEAYTVPKQLSKLGLNTMNPEVLNAYNYQDLPNLGKLLIT